MEECAVTVGGSRGGIPKTPSPPSPTVTLWKITRRKKGRLIMPYAILRFQKRKAGGVAACERHNERKKEAYKSNPDIDVGRSKDNYHLVNPPRYTYKKEINQMVKEAGCKVRKDSVMLVETLITASPESMNSLPPAEQRALFCGGAGLCLRACRKTEYHLRRGAYGAFFRPCGRLRRGYSAFPHVPK